MNVGALSSYSVSIVLAASLLAGSAGAGHILCEDLTGHATKEMGCDYLENKHRIHFDFKDSKHKKVTHAFDEWAQPSFHSVQPNVSVPEPGALALLGIGLVGMALSHRRRRK